MIDLARKFPSIGVSRLKNALDRTFAHPFVLVPAGFHRKGAAGRALSRLDCLRDEWASKIGTEPIGVTHSEANVRICAWWREWRGDAWHGPASGSVQAIFAKKLRGFGGSL
ncbi:hypothetical protein ACVWWG_003562 [Bradyrhizobium sp. LB7.2]